ncbi:MULTISPECIES: hypothetical protein [Cryobacterium]|uniref:hypothetical protein n=1 Tax=Cryobacterium TaxID=69578 RepID=UPI000CD46E21|nr:MULTISPECIES: hypothetical protein [Cryobacterium]POH66772.1 hypothetical protein C3B60_09170 [Cryobacterium zongtaii]TFC42429.1 hypothetical protein E3O57_15180 [Cryobacterium sp. TMN-39-2]
MNKRQLGLTALALTVAVATAGMIVAHLLPASDRIRPVAESTPSATASPTAAESGAPTSTARIDETVPPAPERPQADPAPDTDTEVGPRTSTEVLPPGQVDVTLPPSKPRSALVSLPLPPTVNSLGDVVDGFPTDVMPGIPNSLVGNSSVATQGDRLQSAFKARTTLGTDDVLAFYRHHFAPLGLLETPVTTTERGTTLSFARDDDSVTLSVTAVAGGSSYVLFGVFTAQG